MTTDPTTKPTQAMRAKAAYPLKLPHSIKNAAQRLAAIDGVSLNQFIAVAVAEKLARLNVPRSSWSHALVVRNRRT